MPAKASRRKSEGSIDMRATIKLGDTGDDVKRIQRVFARDKVLGPDDVDGVFGPRTEQAVKDFQQSNGLTADGVVGPITWSHVHPYREASPTLQAGSTGPVVAKLQGVLKTGFGYSGAIDGIFGPVTEAIVRQYQTNSGLPVTGVMDERTWMAPAGAAGATLESLSGLIL
jgi:peptidoglycan hydrolase-like protein with peptidoglycan-binding domain